jgi:hypothetical protein
MDDGVVTRLDLIKGVDDANGLAKTALTMDKLEMLDDRGPEAAHLLGKLLTRPAILRHEPILNSFTRQSSEYGRAAHSLLQREHGSAARASVVDVLDEPMREFQLDHIQTIPQPVAVYDHFVVAKLENIEGRSKNSLTFFRAHPGEALPQISSSVTHVDVVEGR